MEKISTPRPSVPTTRPRRPSAYQELYEKFLQSAKALGMDTSKEAIDRAVHEALKRRNASLVKCPACGQRRRNPRFEFCAECARLAREEDERQAKSGACTPSREESTRLSEEIIRSQRNSAARELHRLYMANKLPEGCVVEYESRRQVRIQTPLALFVIHAAEPKRRPQPMQLAQVIIFPSNTEEIDMGWEATG